MRGDSVQVDAHMEVERFARQVRGLAAGLDRKKHRDPVAAAERSEAALEKVATRKLKGGSPAHSLRMLLDELSTIVRNTCEPRVPSRSRASFQMTTVPIAAQQQAMQLLESITV